MEIVKEVKRSDGLWPFAPIPPCLAVPGLVPWASTSSCTYLQSSWSSLLQKCNRRHWLDETRCQHPSNPRSLDSWRPHRRGSRDPSVSLPALTGRATFPRASPPPMWDPFSLEHQSEAPLPPPSSQLTHCQLPPTTHCQWQSQRMERVQDITWAQSLQPPLTASWPHETGRSMCLERKWYDFMFATVLSPVTRVSSLSKMYLIVSPWVILIFHLATEFVLQPKKIIGLPIDPPGCNGEVEVKTELAGVRHFVEQLPRSRELGVAVPHL